MISTELVTISNAVGLSGRSKYVVECLARRGIIRTEKRGQMTFYNQQDLKILKLKFK